MAIGAVDLGGTLTKVGIVEAGRVVAHNTVESHSARGLGRHLEGVKLAIHSALAHAGLPKSALEGVAFGVPGLVDPGLGRILSIPKEKFDDAASMDLPDWGRTELGVPLKVENDAHAALLGEWKFGAGRGVSNLVNVTLGTGIGTSVLINGRPLRGRHFQAGVLGGHFSVVPRGKPCPCGGTGCFETECGSRALPEKARADARFASSALAVEAQVDFESIFRCAAAGDELALSIRDLALDWWDCVLITLINAYDPERVVVGGGVMRSKDLILPHLQAAARRAWTPWGRVDVQASALGDDAGLLGLSVLFDAPLEYI